MSSRVVIVKLAAIGDVVMACRAVNDWYAECADEDIEIFWVIDRRLKALAERLLKPSNVRWICVDSGLIFRGSFFDKVRESVRMSVRIMMARPRAVIILHRDRRYRILTRLVHYGRLLSVASFDGREIDAYRKTLSKLQMSVRRAGVEGITVQSSRLEKSINRVGILVGGAKNQKLLYEEKRWPRIAELVLELNKQSDKVVVLYGSRDDLPEAEKIITCLPHPERAVNNVGLVELDELPASFSSLDAFISIDSGPAHIAAASMPFSWQRVIVLFGPTSPERWRPESTGEGKVFILDKKLPCSPCYKDDGDFRPCAFAGDEYQRCMRDITVSDVLSLLR